MAAIKKKKRVTEEEVDLVEKFNDWIDSLNTRSINQEELVRASILALLSGASEKFGAHVLLVGPPGCGKTFLIDNIARCIVDATYFGIQYHPMNLPEDTVGFIDPRVSWERQTKGFLPEAEIAKLDEFWKQGPARSMLLSIINEREYRNMGRTMHCPLITAYCASNEQGSPGDPLQDRLLIRLWVDYVSDRESRRAIDKVTRTPWKHPKITLDEIYRAKEEAFGVEWTDETDEAFEQVLAAFVNPAAGLDIVMSDRRIVGIKYLARAEAWLNGRDHTIPSDITAAWPACWRDPKEIRIIKRTIYKITNIELDKILSDHDQAEQIFENVENGRTDADEGAEKLRDIIESLEKMKGISGTNHGEYKNVLTAIKQWHRKILPAALAAMAKRTKDRM